MTFRTQKILKMTNKQHLLLTALLLLSSLAFSKAEQDKDLMMWYDQPAKSFNEGINIL